MSVGLGGGGLGAAEDLGGGGAEEEEEEAAAPLPMSFAYASRAACVFVSKWLVLHGRGKGDVQHQHGLSLELLLQHLSCVVRWFCICPECGGRQHLCGACRSRGVVERVHRLQC